MRKHMILIILAAVVGMMFISTASASAGSSESGNYVTVRAHVSAVALAEAKAEAKATAAGSAYSYVGAQLRIRAASGRCIWATGLNSVSSGGGVYFYPDGVKSYICKLKKPVWVGGHKVSWIKRGGGTTGKNCGNYFIPRQVPKKRSAVLDVRAGAWATVKVWAEATASVSAKAKVSLTFEYNGQTHTDVRVVDVANATDTSRASAKVRIRVKSRSRVKATGRMIARAKAKAKAKAVASAKEKAKAKAVAKAKASVDLSVTIPINGPTPPEVCPPGTVGTWPNCVTPPNNKSIIILSMTDLNDIPTGKSSGPYYVETSASDAGGSLTVDPGIGSLTNCSGGSRQGSMTVAVPQGVTRFCFVIWAPDDPARPTSMTVTATAVLGSLVDRKVDNLLITYPVRP